MAANRRQFLWIALGAGSALSTGAAARLLRTNTSHSAAGSSPQPGELPATSRTAWALGTNVSVTVLHADRTQAEQALTAAFVELETIEETMSLYRPQSQLCRLNRLGRLVQPHPYLVEVLRAALDLSASTKGAFDVTVQPLWSLYATAAKSGQLPDAPEIDAVRKLVDWRRVVLSSERIVLPPGMQVTLDGIAQGFAADRAMAALRSHGIEHALVNAGEIGTLGGRTAQEPWKVGIQHPRQADAYLSLARLEERSLATSGDYATTFSDDYRAHHIFDPRTGLSPPEFASVSIAAPSSMQADALSTAVFVLGLERGMELVQSLPAVDAIFVLKEGRTLSTPEFPLEA